MVVVVAPIETRIGDKTTPAHRIRINWGESLREQLAFLKWTPKQFRHELSLAGLEVSRQAISQWLAGETSPRPHHQAVIASVLRTSVHRLFPVDAA